MAGRIKYVTSYKDRHGKVRWKFQKRGLPSKALPAPTSPEFAAAFEAALNGGQSAPRRDGTFAALAHQFERSPEFRAKGADTRSRYVALFRSLTKELGAFPVASFTPAHVRQIVRAAAHTPTIANQNLSRLRVLFEFAIELGLIERNPAQGIKRLPVKVKGFPPWDADDVARFERRWPARSMQRLAMRLLLDTGQRRSDVHQMGWHHVRGGTISVVQQKTKAELRIPILPTLAEELAGVPRERPTFVVTQMGEPFSVAGFGNWFGDASRAAGLTDRTAHGLRKLAAARLAEAGCSTKEIAAITGHATLAEVQRYTRSADQEELARRAAERLNMGQNG